MNTIALYLLFLGGITCYFIAPKTLATTLHFAAIDYCPFTCNPLLEDGKEGFMTDVLRETFEPAGYTLEIDILPYARAVIATRNGTYDGIVVVGKEYAPELIYPNMPTVVQRAAFFVNAGNPWKYKGIDSLRAITVGIVKGYQYGDPELIEYLNQYQENESKVRVLHGNRTTEVGLRMLQTDRINTFLEGEYSVKYELSKMGISDKIIVAGYTTNAFEDFSGFSPINPNSAKYAQLLSKKLAELKATARLDELVKQYGVTLKQ
ncbi:transporter substrate-binding domain-containing protein [Paraglaciecola aquimarina]|uniref:Transporter substrate-binding domain-containing protein n=1 Tax=Paraglaciecola aquimarina TaxID=1235557 RepID=A0ABU3SVK9_9ALTE|nr:transporter substrate-binding domain-containing protein [Paraglaciecola aquimarina]MDU0354052.1 transporter substrate-binding domain-containing protein [Paraglaciecola aquimarina]